MNGPAAAEQIAAAGRDAFSGPANLGGRNLRELETVAGWPSKPSAVVNAIAAALSIAPDPKVAREAAANAMLNPRNGTYGAHPHKKLC
jgi:hypothetical protein